MMTHSPHRTAGISLIELLGILVLIGSAGLIIYGYSVKYFEGRKRSAASAIAAPLLAGATAQQQHAVNTAFAALMGRCPGFRRHSIDLSDWTAEVGKFIGFSYHDEYGWERAVTITVQVASPTQSIPSSYRASRHRCYYSVGEGHIPGISISKRPCMSVCLDKQKVDHLVDSFVPAPGLRLGIDAAVRTVPSSDSTD